MIRTLTGKNSFKLQEYLHERVQAVMKLSGDLAVERLDASDADIDTLLQSVQSLPFLVDQKLVVITNIQANSALLDRIEELIDRTADSVEVLLVEPNLDKRKSAYKILKAKTELHDFAVPQERDLPNWAVLYAKSIDAIISIQNAQFLVSRVGANQQLLASEIDKLALYNQAISRETIELLTEQSLQNTVFNLLDAAFSGDTERSISMYREQRLARIDPHYIVAMLSWQLQAIALAVYSETKSESELVAAGQSPYGAKKALATARHISKTRLRTMVDELSELDAAIKSTTDPDSAVELYLIGLK